MIWDGIIFLRDSLLAGMGLIDEKALLKNDVFRVVGRKLGSWAWGMLESGVALFIPYVVAGGFAANTDPTLSSLQSYFRYYADKVTNFRPVRWVKSLYQGIDGIVSGTLAFFDKTFNRLSIVPGYKLLTLFYVGSWEYKYKQFKNFIVLRALWDRFIQPYLKQYFFSHYAKVASIYLAPYFDAALRYGDKALSSFLGENYRGGESYSLATLENSCAAGWQESNILWRGLNNVLCGGGVSPQQDEMHKIFSGISLSTAGVEKLAEKNLESLSDLPAYVISGINTANQYALKAIDGVTNPKNAWSEYGQAAVQTTWTFACKNTRYALDSAWNGLLKASPSEKYAKPFAIATTVVAAGTCLFLGYKLARRKWNQVPTPTVNVNLNGQLNVAPVPVSQVQQPPAYQPPANAVAAQVAVLNVRG